MVDAALTDPLPPPTVRVAVWALAGLAGVTGCSASHCAEPVDAGLGSLDARDAPRLDAGPCPSGEGVLVLGPVIAATGCGSGDGFPMEYWIFDSAARPVAWGREECGRDGTDFLRVGALPAGRYFVAAEAAGGRSLAGGELLRSTACAEIAVTMPWLVAACSPIEVDVEACGTAVVPVLLHPGPGG